MYIHNRNKAISSIKVIILVSFCLFFNIENATSASSYEEAKSILDSNCSDCYGETKEGLEKGISAMESLINSGVTIPIAGRLVLAESYNSLAYRYYTDKDKEQKLLINKYVELYRTLGDEVFNIIDNNTFDNNDIIVYLKVLDRYAAHSDSDKRIVILEKTLNLKPDDSGVRFTYGNVLYEEGKSKEGLVQMERAFTKSQYGQAVNQGIILINLYNNLGKYDEAKRVFSILETKNLDQDITSIKKNLISDYKKIMNIEQPINSRKKGGRS